MNPDFFSRPASSVCDKGHGARCTLRSGVESHVGVGGHYGGLCKAVRDFIVKDLSIEVHGVASGLGTKRHRTVLATMRDRAH